MRHGEKIETLVSSSKLLTFDEYLNYYKVPSSAKENSSISIMM